jgi:photosystem II stability/assembly factor-like uncharacterized protein
MSPKSQVAAVLATLTLLAALWGYAQAQQYAPVMPLAARSTLLDICAAGERVVVAGEYGNVLFSDDNGGNWRQAAVPTTQMLTGLFFIDGLHGWSVGHDGLILASDDGGENWRLQRDGLAAQHELNLEVRDAARRHVAELERRLAAADAQTRAQIETELEDGRVSLEDADLTLAEPVFTAPLMDVWFNDAKRGWAVGAFGTLLATEDGGQHWASRQAQLDNPEECHLNAITGDNKGRVFIAGECGVMYRSMDNGGKWESLQPFYEGSWFGSVYDAKHDALLVFGLRGNLFRSTDFGATWEPVSQDNTNTLAGGTASPQGEIVLAGAGGTVLRSTDGGQSFQHNVIKDRLNLSSGLSHGGRLLLVGQGGVRIDNGEIDHE